MLLALAPRDGFAYFRVQADAQPAGGPDVIEKCDAEQPPEGRIDATEIPEIDFLLAQVDELRDLSVRSLMPGQRQERGRGFALEQRVAGECHADRANRRVACEDCRVAARPRRRRRGRRQNAAGPEIALEQRDRLDAAALDGGGVLRRFHGEDATGSMNGILHSAEGSRAAARCVHRR